MNNEFSRTGAFKGVPITQPSDAQQMKYRGFRTQFIQALFDNIKRRFDDKGVLEEAAVLNPTSWPVEEDARILFGDDKVMNLCKTLKFNVSRPLTIKEFREHKDTQRMGDNLNKLVTTVGVIPVVHC